MAACNPCQSASVKMPDSPTLRQLREQPQIWWLAQANDQMNQFEQMEGRKHLWESLSSPRPQGTICHWQKSNLEVHRSSQSHGVTEVLCWNAVAGERGTNTQPSFIMTIKIATYEERVVLMVKSLSMLSERYGNEVITVWTVQHTQMNKKWEQRGSHSQRYSWWLGGMRSAQGQLDWFSISYNTPLYFSTN